MAVKLIGHCWYFVEAIFNQEFGMSLAIKAILFYQQFPETDVYPNIHLLIPVPKM